MKLNNREDIIQLTPKWKGERFDDGRPRVSDDLLRRVAENTITELWMPLFMRGYKYQFERSLKRTNTEKDVMIGRAVTATFLPTRPDLHNYLLDYGHEVEGRKGNFNQWAIEGLVKDDVLIYDLQGKVYEGCPLGGNLTNVIASKTGQGAITWGGMRDLEQVLEIKNAQFYYIDTDPTPFRDLMITGINVPCKIGSAVCMPGDVVLGTISGIMFIPPHLAEISVITAEKSHVRDIWGFIRVREKKFTAAQMDSPWELEMWEDFIEWFGKDKEAEPYHHLNFDRELADIRAGIIRKASEMIEDEDEEVEKKQGTRW